MAKNSPGPAQGNSRSTSYAPSIGNGTRRWNRTHGQLVAHVEDRVIFDAQSAISWRIAVREREISPALSRGITAALPVQACLPLPNNAKVSTATPPRLGLSPGGSTPAPHSLLTSALGMPTSAEGVFPAVCRGSRPRCGRTSLIAACSQPAPVAGPLRDEGLDVLDHARCPVSDQPARPCGISPNNASSTSPPAAMQLIDLLHHALGHTLIGRALNNRAGGARLFPFLQDLNRPSRMVSALGSSAHVVISPCRTLLRHLMRP
jgi:hypothetical protein